MYSLPLDILFIRPDSRDLVDDLILTLSHRPHYPELPLLRTLRYHRRRFDKIFIFRG